MLMPWTQCTSAAAGAVEHQLPEFSFQADLSKPACTQADFAIGGGAPVGASVPSGVGVGGWTGLTVTMINGPLNQDNCKTVTVPINYTSN